MSHDEAIIVETLRLESDFDLLNLYRHNPRRYPFLLETVSSADNVPGHDILFAFPGPTLRLDKSGIHFDAEVPASVKSFSAETFLDRFDEWWNAEKRLAPTQTLSHLPFTGGWFLYLSYELCAQVEPGLRHKVHYDELPVALAVRFRTAVIYDRVQNILYCIGEAGCLPLLAQIRDDIRVVLSVSGGTGVLPPQILKMEEDPPRQYLDDVIKIKHYIREGDVFQVNLSRCWQLQALQPVCAGDLYARLRQHNPSPFAGFAAFEDFSLLSSSPERLLRVRGGIAETRPIAGTRPRGCNPAEDSAYLQELIAHPKERAEHIMLIDLERNDLGRVCEPGSVRVNELMTLESYAHVHHIVSNITGRLRGGVGPGTAIAAVFPGGTITGCPKVRCMEILADLEQSPRGPYTGSMGYVNLNGDLDLNILIRSMAVCGTEIQFRAGAGIVADSDPERELGETRAKAKGMLRALGVE